MLKSAVETVRQKLRSPLASGLVSGASAAFAVRVLGIALGFGLQIALTRWFGAETYGQYIYVFTWITILTLLAKVGLDSASLRFVSSFNATEDWGFLKGYVSRSTLIVAVLAVVVAGGGSVLIELFGEQMRGELVSVFRVGLLVVPAMAMLHLFAANVQALKHTYRAQMPQNVIRPLVLILICAVFAVQGTNLSATQIMILELLATALAAAAIVLAFRSLSVSRIALALPRFDTEYWVRSALPMFFVSGAQLGLARADIIMIGILMGPLWAGKYAIASLLAGLILLPIQTANMIIAPTVAELHAQNRQAELQRVTTVSAIALSAVTLPVLVVISAFGELFLGIFGSEFTDQYYVTLILSLGNTVIVACGSVGYLLTMTGNQLRGSWVIGLSLVVNIVLNYLLIPRYGVVGAAMATAISLSLRSLALSVFVWTRLGIVPTVFGPLFYRRSNSTNAG